MLILYALSVCVFWLGYMICLDISFSHKAFHVLTTAKEGCESNVHLRSYQLSHLSALK